MIKREISSDLKHLLFWNLDSKLLSIKQFLPSIECYVIDFCKHKCHDKSLNYPFYVKCGILEREEKLCNIFYVYWVDLSITSLSCCCKCSFSFPWDLRGVLEICWAFSHLFDTHSWSSIALKTNSDLYKSHWKTANISKWSRYQYW